MAEANGWQSEFSYLLLIHENGKPEDYQKTYDALLNFIIARNRTARLAGFDEAVKVVKKMYMGGHESNALKILFEKRTELMSGEEKA